jgi:hypothetical protein
MTAFGFPLAPAAAHTLATRIFWVRLAGVGFALVLLLGVAVYRSRTARLALFLRWVMGLATSPAFLCGIGLLTSSAIGLMTVAASMFQLAIEGSAILLLFGPDAVAWLRGDYQDSFAAR